MTLPINPVVKSLSLYLMYTKPISSIRHKHMIKLDTVDYGTNLTSAARAKQQFIIIHLKQTCQ